MIDQGVCIVKVVIYFAESIGDYNEILNSLEPGSYLPTLVCGGYAEDSNFGFSGFDNNGLMQWTVADLHIDSIAANRPHWLIQELMVHAQN